MTGLEMRNDGGPRVLSPPLQGLGSPELQRVAKILGVKILGVTILGVTILGVTRAILRMPNQ